MSYYHKRSISGVTGNTINPIIKVSRPGGGVSIKTNSLTPNKYIDQGNIKKPAKELDKSANLNLSKKSNRPITSTSLLASHMNASYRKDYKNSNYSYDDENKIKVNKSGLSGTSKSPVRDIKKSGKQSPEKVSALKGTFTVGFNKPSYSSKNESLLKKYEEIKNLNVKDIISNSQGQSSKLGGKNISVKDEPINISTSTSIKMQPRGTVAFNGPEDFVNNRDNKFKSIQNFKEMTTSPLLIRV
jgi:hypothetical protein